MLDNNDLLAIAKLLGVQKDEIMGETKVLLAEHDKSLRDTITQQGLDLRTEMAQQSADLRAEMVQQGTELRAEMAQQNADLRADLRAEMAQQNAEQRTELRAEMAQQSADLRSEMQNQKNDIITEIKALIDTEITPKFNLLADGQAILIERTDNLVSRVEALEVTVGAHDMAIRKLNNEVELLKKAN